MPTPVGYCSVNDVCSAFPQFQRDAHGSVQDTDIAGWILDRKARIRSALLTRGFDPDLNILTSDQANFLRALNRDGAIPDLGSAIQGTTTLQPGEYSLAQAHRKTYETVLTEITKGLHDKLFNIRSRTTDVGPLFGGVSGGDVIDDGLITYESSTLFHKNQVF